MARGTVQQLCDQWFYLTWYVHTCMIGRNHWQNRMNEQNQTWWWGFGQDVGYFSMTVVNTMTEAAYRRSGVGSLRWWGGTAASNSILSWSIS